MTLMPERRRYPRFAAWLPLRLTAVAGKIELSTVNWLTQNISKAGVCFPAPRRTERGQAIEVVDQAAKISVYPAQVASCRSSLATNRTGKNWPPSSTSHLQVTNLAGIS
jgi:hypothetical protein